MLVRAEFQGFNSLVINLSLGLFEEGRLGVFTGQVKDLTGSDCMCFLYFHPSIAEPERILQSEGCGRDCSRRLMRTLREAQKMPADPIEGYWVFDGKEIPGIVAGAWRNFFLGVDRCFRGHGRSGYYLFGAFQVGQGCGLLALKRGLERNPEFLGEVRETVAELCPHLSNYVRLRYLTALWHREGGVGSFFRAKGLSRREIEIAVLAMKGLSLPETGQRLKISEETIRDHLKNIYKKLGVHSKTELVTCFIRLWEKAMQGALGRKPELE